MRAGFSLIELLIVVGLIVVLTVMSQGALSARRQKGMKAVCAEHLQKLYVSLSLYANDHHGAFPLVTNARTSSQALSTLVPRYTSETRTFRCPGIGKPKDLPIDDFASSKIHYSYYMGRELKNEKEAPLMTDAQVDDRSKTSGQRLFSASGRPPGNNHSKSGGNILLIDGSVKPTGSNAPFAMLLDGNVTLLNPRP